jgi:hypothetical protein
VSLGRALVAAAVALAGPVRAQDQADGGVMSVESFELTPAPASTIEAFESVDAGVAPVAVTAPVIEAFAPPPSTPSVRVYGFLGGLSSVDTRFDSPRGAPMGENVAELRVRALVGVDVKLGTHLRLVVEGRAQARLATQRDFDRFKGFFEPTLGDAYLDLYTSAVDLRVGNQRIALGANAGLSGADALNPRDLRESLLSGEPDDAILPVFAIRAQGVWKGFSWLAAYAPFFTPDTYTVFGQDEALLQPGLGPVFDTSRIDPSIEDHLQSVILETKRPLPFAGDLALRVRREGRVTVGASWVWQNQKLPRVTIDGELSRLLSAQAQGKPTDAAAAVSLLNRFQANETLATGVSPRTHVFSAEASALLGPGQLDADLSYSPRTTYVDANFNPLDKATFTWVLGYSVANDSPVTWSVSYLGLAVPDVGAQQQLILLEPATAVGGARTAFFHLFSGFVAVPFADKKFELSLRAAFEPIQRSFAAGPRFTWQGVGGLKVYAAAEFWVGQAWTPFGYFSRNDKVLVGVRYEL